MEYKSQTVAFVQQNQIQTAYRSQLRSTVDSAMRACINCSMQTVKLTKLEKENTKLKRLIKSLNANNTPKGVRHTTAMRYKQKLQQEKVKCRDLESEVAMLKSELKDMKGKMATDKEVLMWTEENLEKCHSEVKGMRQALESFKKSREEEMFDLTTKSVQLQIENCLLKDERLRMQQFVEEVEKCTQFTPSSSHMTLEELELQVQEKFKVVSNSTAPATPRQANVGDNRESVTAFVGTQNRVEPPIVDDAESAQSAECAPGTHYNKPVRFTLDCGRVSRKTVICTTKPSWMETDDASHLNHVDLIPTPTSPSRLASSSQCHYLPSSR